MEIFIILLLGCPSVLAALWIIGSFVERIVKMILDFIREDWAR